MHYNKLVRTVVLAAGLGLLSSLALADDCGDAPVPPKIVDGSKATMDQMVSNSEEVKGYIAKADDFLDCREAKVNAPDFSKMSDEEKSKWINANADKAQMMRENNAVLKVRNNIGPKFNNEVAAYKKAHPKGEDK